MKQRLGAALAWLEDRTGLVGIVRTVMQHPVPPGATWWYVFGSATLLAFLVQVVTGVVLGSMYVPAPDDAYRSLEFITNDAPAGRLVRGMHAWTATAMIVLIGIHALQVFLFGSYKYPREVNWMTGVLLLAFTLAMAFTGQILRFDNNGVWSTIVLVKMTSYVPVIGDDLGRFFLAGDVVNASTLSHFFTFHVFVIPGLIFAIIGIHLYLVIRNGISEPPEAGRPVDPATYRAWYHDYLRREGVPFWPDAIWRDALFGVLLVVGLLVLAGVIGPPEVGAPPSPANLDTNPRPDWYFIWLFAALALLPPGIEFYFLILGSGLFFIGLFILPLLANRGERSWKMRPWAVGIVCVIVTGVGALTVYGLQAPWSPDFATQPLSAEVVGATTGPVANGAQLFHEKGCHYCHRIAGSGGQRGPDLTTIGDKLSENELIWRIANGGVNMPSFAGTLTQHELREIVAFLQSRRSAPAPAQNVPTVR
ncbi:MAG: cytochrome b [Dehalococcoidia bacterium]|nr:MAG: cytochrome b [Dehalococcoidia bacterium]